MAFFHDKHDIPKVLHHLQHVGADKDGHPLALKLQDDLLQLPDRLGIQTYHGLVKENDLRFHRQSAEDADFLHHSL